MIESGSSVVQDVYMRIAAGVLMIVGGLGAPLWASLAVVIMFVFGLPLFALVGLLIVLGWALMIMSFMGAYFTFRRRRFKLALAGAICSAIALPHVFGLLATMFLVRSEGQFRDSALSEASATEGPPG